jgi:hydrogenase maturation protein HypF
MLERNVRTPQTSSVGRLFDAVAALAGVRDRNTYEGQGAVELEWLATDAPHCGVYPFEIARGSAEAPLTVDTRPVIAAVVQNVKVGAEAAAIARRFHGTMVEIITAMCAALRQQAPQAPVVLSGGVFLNALLAAETDARLTADGFRVLRHRLVPPGDGGLCLGQLAVAAACGLAKPLASQFR